MASFTMADQQDFLHLTGGLFASKYSAYRVQRLLGSGGSAVVAQCYKYSTREIVAVKVIQDKDDKDLAMEEANILRRMQALNSNNFNIVNLKDSFIYNDHYCLEFELLGMNLSQYMAVRGSPLELKEIRPVMHQLATALQFLKSAGIVHGDMKPDNVLMVNRPGEPLKIKVSDFGLAHDNPATHTGQDLQTLGYTSPEVLLGAPYTEAIDMWSLGCIGAELLTGVPLFIGESTFDIMRHHVRTVGQPPDSMLDVGRYTTLYFQKNGLQWELMYSSHAGESVNSPRITNLEDLVTVSQKESLVDVTADTCDIIYYVHLLSHMLQPDARMRLTPDETLLHPFVTMSHFADMRSSPHVKSCMELMASCLGGSAHQDVARQVTSSLTAGLCRDEFSLARYRRPRNEPECVNSTKRE